MIESGVNVSWRASRLRNRVLYMLIGASLLGGCAQPRSTRFTANDYEEIVSGLSAKLQEGFVSGALASRTIDSPMMTISIQKVVNLTTDLMSESEKWYVMYKVKDALPRSMLRERNVQFVIPAEHLRDAKKIGEVENDSILDRAPTHAMSATFRSATRVAGKDRTEGYLCAYQITDLKQGELVLSGDVIIKRFAVGRLGD